MKLLMELMKKPGTFAGVHLNTATKQAIHQYNKVNDIANPIHPQDMHITLLYSKKLLPDYVARGKISEIATPKKFTIFESSPTNGDKPTDCLVLLVKCDFLTNRFEELMDEHNATYDFAEYIPHITFSYDAGNVDISSLPKFKEDIKIIEEYQQAINE